MSSVFGETSCICSQSQMFGKKDNTEIVRRLLFSSQNEHTHFTSFPKEIHQIFIITAKDFFI